MKHPGRTRPFRDANGKILPESIAEVKYLTLGGVDQWVMMRGESRANPPLILLHGGPGMTEARFFRRYNAPLEKSFTVVNWDQRGTGKSFDPAIPKSTMTVEQLISDLDELVDHVRGRLGQPRVVIFGHSWGSGLGTLHAARFPQKVAAYVGSGQYGDAQAAEAASYAFALAEAERLGNEKALKDLRRIGRPPYPAASVFVERTWLSRLEGYIRPRILGELARMTVAGPEFSVADLPGFWRGFRFSMETLGQEASRLDLNELVPALEMPVFFFLGRRDHWVPPETSEAYFAGLQAPQKTLVWFEESGHEPFMDEAEKFNGAMVELVRPAALEAQWGGARAPTAQEPTRAAS